MTEKWKPIPEFEGFYQASDQGRVRCLDRIDGQGRNWQGRVLRSRLSRHGYPLVTLCVEGIHFTRTVHRLVLETFVGGCPENYESRHLNGVRDDPRLCNLMWGTRVENMADKLLHGTDGRGSKNTMAKLTDEQVCEVFTLYGQGWLQREIGEKFGINQNAVSRILNGRRWQHVA